MTASILTIGDEILIGQIQDTNSTYIAKVLDKIGVTVYETRSISDEEKHIKLSLQTYLNNVDVVIITGGLGPTKDDVTKKTLTSFFNDYLVENTLVLKHVTTLIENIQKRPITPINKEQALVPSKATLLFNTLGTAPGLWMQKENTNYIFLPGVPYEMKELMQTQVLPRLQKQFQLPYKIHKTIMTYGKSESLIAEQIEAWETNLPNFIKLAYLPSPGRVRLRLSATGTDKKEIENILQLEIKKIQKHIGDSIVGYNEDEPVEVILGKILTEKKLTLSTAESCTGGKIASRITQVKGASHYFKGSIISYATEIKTQTLGISKELIEKHSVVSEQVAKAMALAVQNKLQTDIAIATTGNAGPLKGDADVSIGTVYIAIAIKETIFVEKFNFGQPREKVINRAVNKSLELVYKEIFKK